MTDELQLLQALAPGFIGVLWAYYLGQCLWVHLGWLRLLRGPCPAVPTAPAPPLSILIPYHNEASTLPRLLACLAAQQHPALEIVLVDDRSVDEGPAQVAAWAAKQTHSVQQLRIAETPTGWSPKKWALHQGLQRCRHSMVLQTDADCTFGPQWAQLMQQPLLAGADVVIGHGALQAPKGFWGDVMAYEHLHTSWLMLGMAGVGTPYMAVGRNLAYRKAAHPEHSWAAFAHCLSGDDDLFIQHRRRGLAVRVQPCPHAYTHSPLPHTARVWMQQKRRHLTAARHYRRHWQLALGLQGLVPLACAAHLAYSPAHAWLWLVPLCLKIHSLSRASRQLRTRPGLLKLPLLELFWYLYGWATALSSYVVLPKWQKRVEIKKGA
ncbi:MAG: glycosyltransferase [Bacteroidetes bacterium]|nr:glycosyltransferase [Bacteroidota bacterium]